MTHHLKAFWFAKNSMMLTQMAGLKASKFVGRSIVMNIEVTSHMFISPRTVVLYQENSWSNNVSRTWPLTHIASRQISHYLNLQVSKMQSLRIISNSLLGEFSNYMAKYNRRKKAQSPHNRAAPLFRRRWLLYFCETLMILKFSPQKGRGRGRTKLCKC